jgi:hypothetical protein
MNVNLKRYFVYEGVPYLGERLCPDRVLVGFYERMQRDGTLAEINYEGQVPDVAAFVRIARGADYFAAVESDGEAVAVVWLNRYAGRRAHLHFCTFATIWGEWTVPVGKQVLDQLIHFKDEHGYLMDVIWGIVPTANRRALEYALACGGVLCGTIPGYIWNAAEKRSEAGAIISYTRRGDDDESLP